MMTRLSMVGLTALMTLTACPPGGDPDGGPVDRRAVDGAGGEAGADGGGDASGCRPCGEVTVLGTCDGGTLRFCDNTCLVERDCQTAPGGPYSCGMYGAFYECLAGPGQACEPDYFNCDPVAGCTGNFPCVTGLACVDLICKVPGDAGGVDGDTPDVVESDGAGDVGPNEDGAIADMAVGDALAADVVVADRMLADVTSTDAMSDAMRVDQTVADLRSNDVSLPDVTSSGDTATVDGGGALDSAGIDSPGPTDAVVADISG